MHSHINRLLAVGATLASLGILSPMRLCAHEKTASFILREDRQQGPNGEITLRVFRAGQHNYRFLPPQGRDWRVTSSTTELHFINDAVASSEATVRLASVTEATLLNTPDPSIRTEFFRRALLLLGSTDIVAEPLQIAPIPTLGPKSFAVPFRYKFCNVRYKCVFSLFQLNEETTSVTLVVATESDFASFYLPISLALSSIAEIDSVATGAPN